MANSLGQKCCVYICVHRTLERNLGKVGSQCFFFLSFFLPLLTNYILRCYVLNMRRTGCFPNERFGFSVKFQCSVSICSGCSHLRLVLGGQFNWLFNYYSARLNYVHFISALISLFLKAPWWLLLVKLAVESLHCCLHYWGRWRRRKATWLSRCDMSEELFSCLWVVPEGF